MHWSSLNCTAPSREYVNWSISIDDLRVALDLRFSATSDLEIRASEFPWIVKYMKYFHGIVCFPWLNSILLWGFYRTGYIFPRGKLSNALSAACPMKYDGNWIG